MSRPKAIQCLLGDVSGAAEEKGLRDAGFLVFTFRWKHFDAEPLGWMRLRAFFPGQERHRLGAGRPA